MSEIASILRTADKTLLISATTGSFLVAGGAVSCWLTDTKVISAVAAFCGLGICLTSLQNMKMLANKRTEMDEELTPDFILLEAERLERKTLQYVIESLEPLAWTLQSDRPMVETRSLDCDSTIKFLEEVENNMVNQLNEICLRNEVDNYSTFSFTRLKYYINELDIQLIEELIQVIHSMDVDRGLEEIVTELQNWFAELDEGVERVTERNEGRDEVGPQVPGMAEVGPQVPGMAEVGPQVPGMAEVGPQVPEVVDERRIDDIDNIIDLLNIRMGELLARRQAPRLPPVVDEPEIRPVVDEPEIRPVVDEPEIRPVVDDDPNADWNNDIHLLNLPIPEAVNVLPIHQAAHGHQHDFLDDVIRLLNLPIPEARAGPQVPRLHEAVNVPPIQPVVDEDAALNNAIHLLNLPIPVGIWVGPRVPRFREDVDEAPIPGRNSFFRDPFSDRRERGF